MVDSIPNTSLVSSAIDHAISMDTFDKTRSLLLPLIITINLASN